MASEQVRGHLAIAAAYSIFGLNVVLCKDIANSAVVSPYLLFTLRAIDSAIYIFTCVAGVLFSVKTYRKKMEACDILIESLENE